MHENQDAYVGGKSCETSLHFVVGRIKDYLEDKDTTLGAFLDIECAFDKKSMSIERTPRNKGANDTIILWMLSNKTVEM